MIAQLVPLAIGIAVNPIPVIALIFILMSPRTVRSGAAFLGAWLAALMALGVVATLIGNSTSLFDSGYSSPVARMIKAIVGVLLVVLAVRKWLGRPRRGDDAPPPRWMTSLASATPARSSALGAGLAAGNPKNVALTIAAAAAIVETGLSTSGSILAMAMFTLASSVGVAVPLVAYLAVGERAPEMLQRWSAWLTRNSAVILSIVMAVIAVVLLVGAVTG